MNRQLLLVDAGTGHAETYRLNEELGLDEDRAVGPLATWNFILPIGTTATGAVLLGYRAADGHTARWRLAGSGHLEAMPPVASPGPGWDIASLYGYDLQSRPQVIFYSRQTGTAEMRVLAADGTWSPGFVSRGWHGGWSQMVTFRAFDGSSADLLLVDAAGQRAQIWRIDSNGRYTHVRGFPGWYQGWTRIELLRRRADECDLLFYAAGTAMTHAWTIRRNGQISLVHQFNGWRSTWQHVVCVDPQTLQALEGGVPVVSGQDLDAWIRSLGDLRAAEYRSATPMPPEVREIGGIAYEVRREAVRLSLPTSEQFLLSPMADQIWPGAVLQGRAMAAQQLAPIPLQRAGGSLVITTDLVGAGATLSTRINQVSLADINQARRQLLIQANPTDSPGAFRWAYSSARTLEHGLVNLGVNVKYQKVNVDLKASLEHELKTTTVIARFLQVYYTAAFEPDPAPGGFFAPGVGVEQLRAYAGPEDPPVYVSQVMYGRMLVLVAQAEDSETKIRGALDVIVNAAANVTVDLDGSYRNQINTLRLQAIEVGGNGVAVRTLFEGQVGQVADNLLAYIRAGSTFSLANPGAAIGFTVRHVGSRTPAAVALATDFQDVVSVTSPELTGSLEIADGAQGGPKPAGVRVGIGDRITVTADGQNWSGIWGSRLYGPDGHPQAWFVFGPTPTAGYPLPEATPFALIAGFDKSDWVLVGGAKTFEVHWTGNGGPRELWFATNDNNPYNGDDARKFRVSWRVRRATAEQLGLHAVGAR